MALPYDASVPVCEPGGPFSLSSHPGPTHTHPIASTQMAQKEVQVRPQATTPDSDLSERPAGDPDSPCGGPGLALRGTRPAGDLDSRRLSAEDLRRFVAEERKSYKEERKNYIEQIRLLNVLLDRAVEARARNEEALARSRVQARCCTII